jgi:hypothetical protein
VSEQPRKENFLGPLSPGGREPERGGTVQTSAFAPFLARDSRTVSVENLQKWLDAKEQFARKSAMLAQFSFITMYFFKSQAAIAQRNALENAN